MELAPEHLAAQQPTLVADHALYLDPRGHVTEPVDRPDRHVPLFDRDVLVLLFARGDVVSWPARVVLRLASFILKYHAHPMRVIMVFY